MMANRNSSQNPVLEIKRDGYLAAGKEIRDDLLTAYKQSIAKTNHLHASLLFTTQYGHSILTSICRLVTYVDPTIINISWPDLAAKLGFSDVHVKCANNLRGHVYDPTELVIEYYAATKKEATVGGVLQALLELGLLPALHQAHKHVDKLLAEVEDMKADIIEVPLDSEELEIKNILKAANFKPYVPAIFDSLPSKETTVMMVQSLYNGTREEETVQRARPQTQTKPKSTKKYCKIVMLSFASDGQSSALRIASELRGTTNKKGAPIGVLMLCENDEKIQRNPGQMIPEILSKVDFIIPVLTEGYFAALKHPNPSARLLDERYIQFIHDILISKYIHNQCLNIQVRPVIPTQEVDHIYSKQEFIHNSIFNAWKSDDEIAVLADNIVKSRRNIVN